jgi:hypothetical protein
MTILEHTGAALLPAVGKLTDGQSKLFLNKSGVRTRICGCLASPTSITYVVKFGVNEHLIVESSDIIEFEEVL